MEDKKKNNQAEYIIELNGLTKVYDGKTVVDHIDLKIKRGEFVTLLGPSGCGKTTTLRMIAGFERPDEGSITLEGKDIADLPPYKRPVNTVFQKYALFPHLNVYKNIAFGLKLKKVEVTKKNIFGKEVTKLVNMAYMPVEQKVVRKDGSEVVKTVPFCRSYQMMTVTTKKGVKKIKKVNLYKKFIDDKVKHALRIVGLSGYEDRDVNSLSGGQQQRVAIARAIVNEPQILLLDEPLGALDLKMRQEMQLELKDMHKKLGITFIYVTHDQEEALTMSDTVVVMKDGVIMQEGSPIEIYNEPTSAYVADFIGESNILDGIMPEDKKVVFAGAEFECVDTGFAPNEEVDVVIRPEDWVIKREGNGILSGEITGCMFRGVHYEMTCLAGGYELILHNTVEYKPGRKIGLYVDPENIQIMHKQHMNNTLPVRFASNTTFEMCGGTYTFKPEACFDNCEYDEENDVLRINGEEIVLKGREAKVSFEFDSIDMTDDEYAAPLAGNVESMIYKGKNYLVDIKTDDNSHIYADTEYLWDKYDRVGIKIEEDKFAFSDCDFIEKSSLINTGEEKNA